MKQRSKRREPKHSTYRQEASPDERFLNRELGILAFNRRVLAMAADEEIPLLERLRYLCIVSSNLDEFFEIRVSGLAEQYRQSHEFRLNDGYYVRDILQRVSREAHVLVKNQYLLLNEKILPKLAEQGICIHMVASWNESLWDWARAYFRSHVLPVLTPIGLDPAHPFPLVYNKSLNVAVELSGKDAFGREASLAVVQAPRALPRLIRLPTEISGYPWGFVTLTSIMQGCVPELFPDMTVHGVYQFRVTRNSDLYVDEEEITNLRVALQGELSQRHLGDAVRLEVVDNTSDVVTDRLLQELELERDALYRVNGPVNLVRLMQVADLVDRPDLKFPIFYPGLPPGISTDTDYFQLLQQQDLLLHHPYQSFMPVLDFLKQAAADPSVVAIKQTIYRTGTDSALMETLVAAARSGKEVTVVVELMARFDEEANIRWASRLEQVGAHVVYGVVGHKTHAKMLLVVRRELSAGGETLLKRYVHLGTGNYHPRTARLYTDFGLFSANPVLCQDVHELFQQLTGLGGIRPMNLVWQAPFTLYEHLMHAIKTETEAAKAGRVAHIMARMNALQEPNMIEALYEASQAGVKIDLLVRGMCTLRPGVPGLSDNIAVRSVVGRFLEHSRIYYFHANGQERVYLSSADWMDRNLFKRVELAFPVLDPELKQRVIEEGLLHCFHDNCLAWSMDERGQYEPVRAQPPDVESFNSQLRLLAMLQRQPGR